MLIFHYSQPSTFNIIITRTMNRKVGVEIISCIFILLFVYAGFAKLLNLQQFRIQIGQSPVLTSIAGITAWLVPLGEIAVSISLAITRFRMAGLLASFGLMVMFSAYIVSILQFGDNIPCSCGGVLESLGWTEHLVFNIVFTFLAAAGIFMESGRRQGRQTVYE
jgi:uncharacterized membrane protein YphA (DoxX/SURF4 family)